MVFFLIRAIHFQELWYFDYHKNKKHIPFILQTFLNYKIGNSQSSFLIIRIIATLLITILIPTIL